MKRLIIKTEDLLQNIRTLHEKTEKEIIGVVKGNGYGLGLIPFAQLLVENGINTLAVTELCDACALREVGLTDCEILLMTPLYNKDDIKTLLENNITASISSTSCAYLLQEVCQAEEKNAKVHSKVDTGMGRYGFLPGEEAQLAEALISCKNLQPTGVYSHLHSAFGKEKTVKKQLASFLSFVEKTEALGVTLGKKHIANSAATLRFKSAHLDAVRIGSAFTGRLPAKNCCGLKRIGCLETEITELRTLKKGATSGYAAAFRAKKETKIAVIPLGTQDGFALQKQQELFSFRAFLRACLTEFRRFIKNNRIAKVRINGATYSAIGRIGLVSSVISLEEKRRKKAPPQQPPAITVGTVVQADCNPLFIGAHVERHYV